MRFFTTTMLSCLLLTLPIVSSAKTTSDDNILLGVPRDPSYQSEVMIKRSQYALLYADYTKTPVWVSWHTDRDDVGNEPDCNCFSPDPMLPRGFVPLIGDEFSGLGFDTVRVCPSESRSASPDDNMTTFFTTNIIPMFPATHTKEWNSFTNYLKDRVDQNYEVYEVAGTIGVSQWIPSKGGSPIGVPNEVFRAAIILPYGDNDLERANNRDGEFYSILLENYDNGTSNIPWYGYSKNSEHGKVKIKQSYDDNYGNNVTDTTSWKEKRKSYKDINSKAGVKIFNKVNLDLYPDMNSGNNNNNDYY